MGGLPSWLLAGGKYKGIKLRTSQKTFLAAVDKWFAELYGRLAKFMRHKGGPIIMVQVENEYGSYGIQTGYCDIEYMAHLRDLAWEHLGRKTFLFTTDGYGLNNVRCGYVPGAYATVDFGPGTNCSRAFYNQRQFEPHGPLVNSEFYPGWLDNWSKPHNKVSTEAVVKALDAMLEMGANVNMYMAHGGTSFGFGAGANGPYFPEPTSYDYDAPLSEAGDMTEKYMAIRKTIQKYLPLPNLPVSNSTKAAYGLVKLKPVGAVTDLVKGSNFIDWTYNYTPLTFEQLGHSKGFVYYETGLKFAPMVPAELSVKGLADRGYVYVDGEFRGVLSRMGDITTMPLSIRKGQTLQVDTSTQFMLIPDGV